MTSEIKIAVLYHIFYEDTITYLAAELESLRALQPQFFFNISADAPNGQEIKMLLTHQFPHAVITVSSNKGKDLGGKLLLLNICIQSRYEPDWIIFLHDKKSLQALNAKTWKNDLLKIIDGNQIDRIHTAIPQKKNLGIVATQDYVLEQTTEDGMFMGVNGKILDQLVQQYHINCKKYSYVAGTMFWGNGHALLRFFKKYNPVTIRQTLEEGNVLDDFGGTHTHSWERMLSWIILSQGLYIKHI